MRMVVAAAAGALLLSGCGDEAGTGGSGALRGKTYLSTAVLENGQPKRLVGTTKVRLRFTDDGRLLADAGCNSLSGPVSTGGGKLSVEEGGLAVTDMGCDAPRHAQDQWLAGLLQQQPAWKVEGDELTVTAGSTTLLLQDRATAEPDVALDGTKWVLETVITGEVASSPATRAAHLTISGERVTGSTGCNDFQGVVARTPGTLTFGELGTTRKACAGQDATLEKAVLDTLRGEVGYSIEASRLRLRTSTGSGLDLTAAR